jgi:GAF domain-containing protein
LLERHPESDPLLSKAMTRRRAIVLADAANDADALTQRYEAIGGAKSVIIAPVMHGGRFIGAIEIMNPIDGAPFTEDEGNALSYISEQFAEFVAQRGIVVDAERISQRPSALRAR